MRLELFLSKVLMPLRRRVYTRYSKFVIRNRNTELAYADYINCWLEETQDTKLRTRAEWRKLYGKNAFLVYSHVSKLAFKAFNIRMVGICNACNVFPHENPYNAIRNFKFLEHRSERLNREQIDQFNSNVPLEIV